MPWVSDGTPLETPESTAAEGYEQTPNAEGLAGNLALRAQSAWAEGMGALGRVSSEGQFQGASPFQQGMYQAATTDEYGQSIDPSAPAAGSVKTPVMQPDEYNKAYAPPSQSIGTEPMPQGIAQIIGDSKRAQAERDAVLARDPSSWPVRFASSAVASLVDPLNDATLFLPGIGEEAIAARIGEGALARTGARAVAGAATGALAQAPLSAFRGVLSAQDTQDYDLRSAFQDMVTSAAVNAAFHAGFGAVGDLMKWHGDPQVKQDAMRATVAQTIDGQPVDPSPVNGPGASPEQAARGATEEDIERDFHRREKPGGAEPEQPPGQELTLHEEAEQRIVGREVEPAAEEVAPEQPAAAETEQARAEQTQAEQPEEPQPSAEEQARTRRENRERARQERNATNKAYAEKMAAETTPTAHPLDAEGRFPVDDNGNVISEGNEPIAFYTQKQGAQWIVREGHANSADQVFELARHPTQSDMFTARERARIEPTPPAAPTNFADVADHQRMLHENGYAPGMPQGEFDTVKNRVYGPEEAPEETAAASGVAAAETPEAVGETPSNAEERNAETQNVNGQPGEKVQPVDPRVAEAERELQAAMNGGKASVEGAEPATQLHPEDAAAIDQARAASEDANRRSDAYTEAALCMKGE